jgi:hypothetical protein
VGITAFIVEPKKYPGRKAQPIDILGLSNAVRTNVLFFDDFVVSVETEWAPRAKDSRSSCGRFRRGAATVAARSRHRARVLRGQSLEELLTQVRWAHARLVHAARRSPSLDAVCFKRANGEIMMTGRQRLQLLAKHWTEHVGELKAAAAAR